MHQQRDQHRYRKYCQRPHGRKAGFRHDRGHESVDAYRRKFHDPLGHAHHDVKYAVPELEQRFGQLVIEVGHEITEQQREEDDAEHLSFSSSLDDVRRHHALEYFGDIAGAPAFNLLCDFCRVGL